MHRFSTCLSALSRRVLPLFFPSYFFLLPGLNLLPSLSFSSPSSSPPSSVAFLCWCHCRPSCNATCIMAAATPSTREANFCDEPSSSTLFSPFPSFYVRQLREALHPLPADDVDDDINSEPSDDGAERRYSDVSIHSDRLPVNHSLIDHSSAKRSSYTLCTRTKSYPHPAFNPTASRSHPFRRSYPFPPHASNSDNSLASKSITPTTSSASSRSTLLTHHHPLRLARRSPSTPSYLRFSSTQPTLQTKSCLPAVYQPSLSPQPSTPSNSHSPTTLEFPSLAKPTSPLLHPVRSLDVDTSYTFCTPPTSNSLPSFDLDHKHAYPANTRSPTPRHKPASEPHRSKRASFWKLISGRRRSRREKKFSQEPLPTAEQPPRKARPWKYDSFKLKRRSSLRNVSAYPATLANHSVPDQTKSLPSSPLYQRARQRRPRACTRASFSGFSAEDLGSSTRGESSSLSCLVHPPRARLAYYAEDKREPSSFAGYRPRVFVTAEGSSVSSSSDREEDGFFGIPDSNSYLSRRQPRSMQCK
eukprot:gb/GEZJ01001224.1/.p1 GENE.gb/GEZJ01001224.1/~~gb/GEZJ01001224.1/.p1  ORF type:complete len:529 (+),score=40.48 gb/GEZJ01001224.1/:5804-7390(+)